MSQTESDMEEMVEMLLDDEVDCGDFALPSIITQQLTKNESKLVRQCINTQFTAAKSVLRLKESIYKVFVYCIHVVPTFVR